MKRKKRSKKRKKPKVITSGDNNLPEVEFTEDKIQAMKNLAQQIAKTFSQKEERPSTSKTSFQLELELERQEKLKEKQELKKLTAQELLRYNKQKANQREEDTINKVDGCETSVSFSSALEYSEKTADLHRVLVSGKVKDPSIVVNKVKDIQSNIVKTNKNAMSEAKGMDLSDCSNNTISEGRTSSIGESSRKYSECDRSSKRYKKKKSHKEKCHIDTSRTIEGEEVEGLVKSETKKVKVKKHTSERKTSQDDFILGKLFSKKGT